MRSVESKIEKLEKAAAHLPGRHVVRMIVYNPDGSIWSDTGEENPTDTIHVQGVSPDDVNY